MADSVHAAMHAQQGADPQPVIQLGHGDPGIQQLPARHDSMRFVGDP